MFQVISKGQKLNEKTMIKITRFEKIKEDGVPKRVVIGITASNGTKSAYIDWTADIKEIGKTKKDLLNYIKKYMTEITNQAEIDNVKARKTDLEAQLKELQDKGEDTTDIEKRLAELAIPEPRKRIDSLKGQLNTPVITRETDNSIIGEELNL